MDTLSNKVAKLDDASFRTLAEVSPAGMWRTTAAGLCTYVNQAWLDVTGLKGDEWAGEGWTRALHPEDRDRVASAFSAAVAAGVLFRDQWRWLRPDGHTPWVLCMGAPEFDADGRIEAYVGINIDITEAHELTRQLEAERQRAEDAVVAKSRFLANMSHEIRTPMNGVIGFTELLLASPLDEEQRRHATLIAESGRAMMTLLNDILDVSKIEAGQLELESVPIALDDMLRNCLALIEPAAIARGIGHCCALEADLPHSVLGDPLRLRQVLLNLLGNAVKFTERGSITLSAAVSRDHNGERLRIAVHDTGIGIAPGKLDLIFEPFSQADGSTARVHGGSGLGLSISRQLVQRMGGSLRVESAPGSGSTFTVDLPLIRSERAETIMPATHAARPDDVAAFAGKSLLIAEDHDINQQLVLALVRSLGLSAHLAEDGERAVALVLEARAAGTPFAGVLMDVQMPRLDGMEATRRLRRYGISATELPIVALSANCYPDDIAACLAAGMQRHVSKPVSREALVEALLDVWRGEQARLPSDGTATSAPADPLAQRFLAQRDAMLGTIAAIVAGKDGRPDWDGVLRQLHQVAGVALHFGHGRLGDVSARLQHDLRACAAPDARLALLRAGLSDLRAAA